MTDESAIEPADRISATRNLVESAKSVVDVAYVSYLEELIKRPQVYAFRAVVVRQHEALRAALILAEQGLGHLAVASIRPACDEYLWCVYLRSIPPDVASEMFHLLVVHEESSTLHALLEYAGEQGMRDVGFPEGYPFELPATAQDRLVRLAKQLGWPKSKGIIPSAKWLATATDQQRVYEYLYSASSKALHFSASDISRRGWGNDDGPIRLNSSNFSVNRTALALDALCRLFVMTLGEVVQDFEPLAEVPPEWEESFLAAIDRIGRLGEVPISWPAEHNLLPEQSSPFQRLLDEEED